MRTIERQIESSFRPLMDQKEFLLLRRGDRVIFEAQNTKVVQAYNKTSGRTGLVFASILKPSPHVIDIGCLKIKYHNDKMNTLPSRIEFDPNGPSFDGLNSKVYTKTLKDQSKYFQSSNIEFIGSKFKTEFGTFTDQMVLDKLFEKITWGTNQAAELIVLVPLGISYYEKLLIRSSALGPFENLSFINQISSIALAANYKNENGFFLCISSGASNTDVTLFHKSNSTIKAVTQKTNSFGGFDYTDSIYQYIKIQHHLEHEWENKQLFDDCEIAKKSPMNFQVNIPNTNKTFKIDDQKMSEIVLLNNERLYNMIYECFCDAGVNHDNVEQVFMNGGNFSFKPIKEFIEQQLGNKKYTVISDEECLISTKNMDAIDLIEMKYYNIGVELQNNIFYPLSKANHHERAKVESPTKETKKIKLDRKGNEKDEIFNLKENFKSFFGSEKNSQNQSTENIKVSIDVEEQLEDGSGIFKTETKCSNVNIYEGNWGLCENNRLLTSFQIDSLTPFLGNIFKVKCRYTVHGVYDGNEIIHRNVLNSARDIENAVRGFKVLEVDALFQSELEPGPFNANILQKGIVDLIIYDDSRVYYESIKTVLDSLDPQMRTMPIFSVLHQKILIHHDIIDLLTNKPLEFGITSQYSSQVQQILSIMRSLDSELNQADNDQVFDGIEIQLDQIETQEPSLSKYRKYLFKKLNHLRKIRDRTTRLKQKETPNQGVWFYEYKIQMYKLMNRLGDVQISDDLLSDMERQKVLIKSMTFKITFIPFQISNLSMQQIHSQTKLLQITQDLNTLVDTMHLKCLSKFEVDREFMVYQDLVLKIVIKLDGVECFESDDLRMERKRLVKHCEMLLEQTDVLKSFYKK